MTIKKIKLNATTLNRQQQLLIKGGTSDTNGSTNSSDIIIDMDEVMT